MLTFYITFGVQYATTPHPAGWPHPDGWLKVLAPDEDIARAAVIEFLSDGWAFIYDEYEWTPKNAARFYPRGELAVLEVPPPVLTVHDAG